MPTSSTSSIADYQTIHQSLRDQPALTETFDKFIQLFSVVSNEINRLYQVVSMAQELANLDGGSSLARHLMKEAGSTTGDDLGERMSELLNTVGKHYVILPYCIEQLAQNHDIERHEATKASTILQKHLMQMLPEKIRPTAYLIFEQFALSVVTHSEAPLPTKNKPLSL